MLREYEKKVMVEVKRVLNDLKFQSETAIGSKGSDGYMVNPYYFGRVYNIKDSKLPSSVYLDDNSVTNFFYEAVDDKGSVLKNCRINLSVHFKQDSLGSNRTAHLRYGVIEDVNNVSSFCDYYKALAEKYKTGKNSLLTSKEMPIEDFLAKLNAVAKTVRNMKAPSNNSARLLLLSLVSEKFDLPIVEVKDQSVNTKPKKVKKTKAYFEEIYSVKELEGLLDNWKNKYQSAVEKENNLLENSREAKALVQLRELKKGIQSNIKEIQPEYEKVKVQWGNEKNRIEIEAGDDLLLLDQLYTGSTVRKKAVEIAAKAKSLKEALSSADEKIKKAEQKLAEKKANQGIPEAALEQKKNLEYLIKQAHESVQLELEIQKNEAKSQANHTIEKFSGKVDIKKIKEALGAVENYESKNLDNLISSKEKFNKVSAGRRRELNF